MATLGAYMYPDLHRVETYATLESSPIIHILELSVTRIE